MTSQTLSPARSRLNASYRNLTLWTLQGWLAMFFVAAGYAKLSDCLAFAFRFCDLVAIHRPFQIRRAVSPSLGGKGYDGSIFAVPCAVLANA